jgi:transmembrane sensor
MTDTLEKRNISETAAAWIARLDSGDLSADELMELRDWATASPANLRELERLADIWESLDTLKALKKVIAKPVSAFRRSMRNLAIAAGIGALAILTWLFSANLGTDEPVVLTEIYATELGEQRSVEPGEGSTINLNTDSRLSVAYSTSQRVVSLTRGEAFFDVSAEDNRPFIVVTSHGNIVVTGTAFLVRVESTGLEVLVQEGQVQVHTAVEQSPGDSPAVIELTAGEVAMVDSDGSRRVAIEPEKLIRKLGWRDGMLIFDGESLEEVVDEVGRYTSIEIIIDDPSLRERRIGGYFKVGEIEDLLGTLESDFDIEVNRVHGGEVRLTAQTD